MLPEIPLMQRPRADASKGPTVHAGLTLVTDTVESAGQFDGTESVRSPLLVSIARTVELTGCSRSLIYQMIATGSLKAVKAGRRTLIPHTELLRWVESLPPAN